MPKLKLLREAYKPKESEIRKEIMDYLWYIKKIDSWLTHAGQIIPVNDGIPDIMGMFPGSGRTLGIEVKRPGEVPTQKQIEWLERIRRSNGVAFVAYSVEDVESQLEIVRVDKKTIT